jgi:hypothetical protein
MSTKPRIEIRDRIRELRRVPASELIPNLKNWRHHPDKQKKAMRTVFKKSVTRMRFWRDRTRADSSS